jgi:hypothetical protein
LADITLMISYAEDYADPPSNHPAAILLALLAGYAIDDITLLMLIRWLIFFAYWLLLICHY